MGKLTSIGTRTIIAKNSMIEHYFVNMCMFKSWSNFLLEVEKIDLREVPFESQDLNRLNLCLPLSTFIVLVYLFKAAIYEGALQLSD